MKRLLLLAFTACLSFGSVYSQDPKIMVDAFFVNYKEKGPLMALDKLFQTNTWMMERTKDKVDNVKSQLNSVVTVVGDYHGYEFICERSICNSIKTVLIFGKVRSTTLEIYFCIL